LSDVLDFLGRPETRSWRWMQSAANASPDEFPLSGKITGTFWGFCDANNMARSVYSTESTGFIAFFPKLRPQRKTGIQL
jgi:hypothetical protein